MRVYYSPLLKRYLDLDTISSIGDAKLSNGHSRDPYVTFDITLKLHEKPLGYARLLVGAKPDFSTKPTGQIITTETEWKRDPVKDYTYYLRMTTGEWEEPFRLLESDSQVLAVVRLQSQIDPLVEKWLNFPGLEL